MHMMGERRRALALASLLTLAAYLVAYVLAFAAHITPVARIFQQPLPLQVGILALIWLGCWIFALAQRELIAQGAGAYRALLAITEVRGMRGLGLGFGLGMLAAVVAFALAGALTPTLGIVGILAGSALFFLGLPHAPEARYIPDFPAEMYVARQEGMPAPRRIVDADRRP